MDRKINLYQTATLLFVLLFTILENGVRGQNPLNTVVDEGTKNVTIRCPANQWFSFEGFPTSNELDGTKNLNDQTGIVPGDMATMYAVDAKGNLLVREATIFEGNYKYCTAGIYIGINSNGTWMVGSKLVVVREGPVCAFNDPSPANGARVILNCTATYADHSVHPIRAIFTVTNDDGSVVDRSDPIVASRVEPHYYVAYKEVEITYNGCVALTVTLTFAAPTDRSYDIINTNVPIYSKSVTIPATSNACLKNSENVAVFEGTQNVLVGSSRDPSTLQRSVTPSSEQDTDYPITEGNGVVSGMTQYYTETKQGLVILKATAIPGPNQISTAGIYTEMAGDQTTGFKVVVVRGPPTCSSNASDSSPKKGDAVKLTCVAQYADNAIQPFQTRMTLQRDGVTKSVATPRSSFLNGVLTVTATFLITYDSSASDVCVFNFLAPASNDQVASLAYNAPTFSASCAF